MGEQKRYQPENNQQIKVGETEVPHRLLSADEKIQELQMIIQQQKDQIESGHPPLEKPREMPNAQLGEQLNIEKQKNDHLTKEKMVIGEILEGDILNVAANLAQELNQHQSDGYMRQLASSAFEVYHKINELTNSLNQSIHEMNDEPSFREELNQTETSQLSMIPESKQE